MHGRALQHLEAALRMNRELPQVYMNLGNVYGDMNDPSRKSFYYKKVLEIRPDHWQREHILKWLKRFPAPDRLPAPPDG